MTGHTDSRTSELPHTDQPPRNGLTHDLITRARAIQWSTVPSDTVTHARHCLLDWTGVAVSGSVEEVSTIVREQTLTYSDGPGDASLIGWGTTNARDAALVNGVAGHALDFDDVVIQASSHITAAVMPAALAAAEREATSGADLIEAFIAGFELTADLALALGENHYNQGFHSTATLGTFGAAAATAKIRNLDYDSWQHAVGLAATSSSGLKSMFGTMAKPLHAGWAAQNGITAADLAYRGMTAAHHSIERWQGFADTHGQEPDPIVDSATWNLRNNIFKLHAACFLTHASIDAALQVQRDNPMDSREIDSVTVSVHPGHLSACNIRTPTTGTEAKFSLRFAVAAALAGVNLWSAFSDSGTRDERIIRLIDRVTINPSDRVPREMGTVQVTTRCGHTFERTVDSTHELVSPNLAHRQEVLRSKFFALVIPIMGEERATTLSETILSMDESTRVHNFTTHLQEYRNPTDSRSERKRVSQ